MSDDRVLLRHSLLTRLLVTSILIAVAAITAFRNLGGTVNQTFENVHGEFTSAS
ncbi:MAG: hypothetical protein QOH86_1831 [Sphingomonadales bacterium]|nr:hypothetical protein [Sphingomonadales bacterium]